MTDDPTALDIANAFAALRAGAVVARTYEEDGTPVPDPFAVWFPAVEGLFDFVEDAIERLAPGVVDTAQALR